MQCVEVQDVIEERHASVDLRHMQRSQSTTMLQQGVSKREDKQQHAQGHTYKLKGRRIFRHVEEAHHCLLCGTEARKRLWVPVDIGNSQRCGDWKRAYPH